jgi:NhaP-type Na+/H+ or K+/H+ antiporter
MVLALALPTTLPHRELIVTMTFGVVILSLLGQGLSIPSVLRALRVVDSGGSARAFDAAREEFRAARAAVAELDYLTDAGVMPDRIERYLRGRYGLRLEHARSKLREAIVRGDEDVGGRTIGAADGIQLGEDVSPDEARDPRTAGSGARLTMDETVRDVERYLLDVERDRLDDALRTGQVALEAYNELVAELDVRRAALVLSRS